LYTKANLQNAFQHKVVMIYPDLSSYTDAGSNGFSILERDALRSYIEEGGIVIASWMVNQDPYVTELFGISGVAVSYTKSAVVFDMSKPGPHVDFTDAREREVSIWSKLTNTGIKVCCTVNQYCYQRSLTDVSSI
jgi:hypothetical protein